MIKRIIVIALLSFVIINLLLTIYEVYLISSKPDSYVTIYGLNENSSHWHFKSYRNFVLWKIFVSCLYVSLIALSILVLRNPSALAKLFYYSMIAGFVLWSFEH